MNKTYLLMLLAVTPSLCGAKSINNKNFGSATVSEVTSIYDGDTFRANIKGWPNVIGERMSIRINGVDTPEMRGKCRQEKELARQAKQITVKMLRNGRKIKLHNIKRGKYFRLVADVFVDGKSIAEKLIKSKLAYAYHGKTKQSWCK